MESKNKSEQGKGRCLALAGVLFYLEKIMNEIFEMIEGANDVRVYNFVS